MSTYAANRSGTPERSAAPATHLGRLSRRACPRRGWRSAALRTPRDAGRSNHPCGHVSCAQCPKPLGGGASWTLHVKDGDGPTDIGPFVSSPVAAERVRCPCSTRRRQGEHMSLKLALAGDTMLGRGVAERPPEAARGVIALRSCRLVEVRRRPTLFVVNLECCISVRGEARAATPSSRSSFGRRRSPSRRSRSSASTCVTLANDHALDYGQEALLDTVEHLGAAGIAWVGGGGMARGRPRPSCSRRSGFRLAVVATTDHPGRIRGWPGIGPASPTRRSRASVPEWPHASIRSRRGRRRHRHPALGAEHGDRAGAARARRGRDSRGGGATLIAGHSAHVFHGVDGPRLSTTSAASSTTTRSTR